MPIVGKVYLVGGGPGSPDLVTQRGRSLIEKCDALIYDNLVNREICQWAGSKCEQIYVGKAAGKHSLKQSEICDLLIKHASLGQVVVRLKGGDPFVFGRATEELRALSSKSIPFEIVPGVTAAIAASAFSGIPITSRDAASSVVFITGHEDPNKEELSVDFEQFALLGATLCIYMGVGQIHKIQSKLQAGGMDPNTPAVIVENASRQNQRTLFSTLNQLSLIIKKENIKSPAIIMIGNVSNKENSIHGWFEQRPLHGKRILITRARQQISQLKDKLVNEGAEVIEIPLIEVKPFIEKDTVIDVFSEIATYEWIVFTSANGVRYFMDLFFKAFKDVRSFGPMRIACLGDATAKEFEPFHLEVDLISKKQSSIALAEELILTDSLDSANVLVVEGNKNGKELSQKLENDGLAIVDRFQLYETNLVKLDPSEDKVKDYCEKGADVIIFTSTSTVQSYTKNKEILKLKKSACQPIISSIGPATSKELESNGMKVDIESPKASLDKMVESLVHHFQAE
jgi:uroporphyrinogen III methyltransferase/synthase